MFSLKNSIVIVLILSLTICVMSAPLLGGKKQISKDNVQMLNAVETVLPQLQAALKSPEPLTFANGSLKDSIVSAHSQVVSGVKFYVVVEFALENQVSRQELVIWSQPWMKRTVLVSHKAI